MKRLCVDSLDIFIKVYLNIHIGGKSNVNVDDENEDQISLHGR